MLECERDCAHFCDRGRYGPRARKPRGTRRDKRLTRPTAARVPLPQLEVPQPTFFACKIGLSGCGAFGKCNTAHVESSMDVAELPARRRDILTLPLPLAEGGHVIARVLGRVIILE